MLRRRSYLVESDDPRDLERLRVGPFDVEVSRPVGVEPSKRFMQFVEREIPKVAAAIKRSGIRVRLPKIYVVDEGGFVGSLGVHIAGEDNVMIMSQPGMSASTLAHEIGHWLYERLPGRAIEYWREVTDPRRTVITDDDVKAFSKKYRRSKKFIAMTPEEKREHVRSLESDVRTSAVYQELANYMLDRMWTSRAAKECAAEDLKRLKRRVGKRVFVSRVPFSLFHYAAKNEREAFAEFFSSYIIDGPRKSDPAMRSIFKNVLGAGGHRVESSGVSDG